MALDDWCVPSNTYVVFLEALKDILVPEVARITCNILYRFSSRLVLLVILISPLQTACDVKIIRKIKAIF